MNAIPIINHFIWISLSSNSFRGTTPFVRLSWSHSINSITLCLNNKIYLAFPMKYRQKSRIDYNRWNSIQQRNKFGKVIFMILDSFLMLFHQNCYVFVPQGINFRLFNTNFILTKVLNRQIMKYLCKLNDI